MTNFFHRVTDDFSAISRSECCVPKGTASFFWLRSFSLREQTPTIFVSYLSIVPRVHHRQHLRPLVRKSLVSCNRMWNELHSTPPPSPVSGKIDPLGHKQCHFHQNIDMCKCIHWSFKAYWLRDAPTSLTFNNCTLCPYCIYVFCIYRRTNTCATYSINWLVFIAELKSVYCVVRTGSLNEACALSLKG
jgi:hypothetical protein